MAVMSTRIKAIKIHACPGPRRSCGGCGVAVRSRERASLTRDGLTGVPAASSSVPSGAAAGSPPSTLSPVRPRSMSSRNWSTVGLWSASPRFIVSIFQNPPSPTNEVSCMLALVPDYVRRTNAPQGRGFLGGPARTAYASSSLCFRGSPSSTEGLSGGLGE